MLKVLLKKVKNLLVTKNNQIVLLIGLGNPGKEYAETRHNLGFMIIDEIIESYNLSLPKYNKKFNADISEGEIAGKKVIAAKPATFMNNSGKAVQKLARFYKVSGDNIIVIHDDLELAPFKIKVKTGGGAGGHNGIKSVDEHIGNNYERVRIGIGHPRDRKENRIEAYDYVTSRSDFKAAERKKFKSLVTEITREFSLVIEGKTDTFMSKLALFAKNSFGERAR